jgi:DNA modification methylase
MVIVTNPLQHYGSFRDCLRSPIHKWFTYPAGYSYKLVEAKIKEISLNSDSLIADPFLGTGTTSLAARMMGIPSLGIEAHPFVNWVAKVKLYIQYDLKDIQKQMRYVLREANYLQDNLDIRDLWPELIYKCFTEDNLRKLGALRDVLLSEDQELPSTNFLKLALTATLRIVTTAGAGWPYIAPSKYHARIVNRAAFCEFEKICLAMISDVWSVTSSSLSFASYKIESGDARHFDKYAKPESVDLIVTSPPYMNNYDYADRTRLETYFWGIFHSWSDITKEVRDRLIMAATTQVRVSELGKIRNCPGIAGVDSTVHAELQTIIQSLADMRRIKSGKKTYDSVTAGYFEDMLNVIKGSFIVLKPHGQFVLVLGDSAPYGIHIPTDEFIGRIGVSVGFSSYRLDVIRTRGEKWAHNSQRHKVPLRESIVTLVK